MEIVVQKYGGSSVADPDRIKNVAGRIFRKIKAGKKVVVVISAMGKTTDNLIKLAKQINENPDLRELDMLMATGEQVSASLLSIAIHTLGIESTSLNAFQARIRTDGGFTEAKIKNIDSKRIIKLLEKNDAIVVTGFQGINDKGEVVTLGRGGSDTSAVAVAAALNARCEIYSDVAGIYTTDPKIHPRAKKIRKISYDEMLELAASGAKVLHSRAVEIAKKFNIVIYCGSSFNEEEGSYVMGEELIIEKAVVTGLTVMENQTQVVLKDLPVDYALIRNVFEKVADAGLNVDMISIINDNQSLTLSFTIIEEKQKHIENTIKKLFRNISYSMDFHSGFTKISIVGIGMKSETGVAADFFKSLKKIPIRLVTTSEIKISCLIENEYKQAAVEALIKKFKL